MASEQEIAEGLQALFRETNPNSFTSLNDILLRLQSKLGFDLSHKLDFIRSQINLLFSPPTPPTHSLPLPPPPSPALIIPNPNVPNYHPIMMAHGQGQGQVGQQRVFHGHGHGQSFFPRGPTQISFAQPGGPAAAAAVVTDSPLSSPTSKDSSQKPKRRGGPGGLNKLCGVTPQLEAIVGQPAMPRTEIVKQLWAYIRKNNLQDPSNKRKIICNDQLRLVFEVDCTDMFQMNKLLAKHILPLDATKESGQQSKKLKVEESQVPISGPSPPNVKMKVEGSQVPIPQPAPIEESQVPISQPAPVVKMKVEKSQVPIFESAPPIVISEALANFFGTSEMKMVQSDVYKRIEEYIKTEGLEDPLNSMVICDSKLQELLGCESITASAICDTLARNHLFQQA